MPVTINGTTGISTPGLTNSSGDMTITNGNLVLGTSGKGIDFSATSGTGTSELLADYEEGTWTPNIVGESIAGTATYAAGGQVGRYTKIGRVVYYQIYLSWTAHTGTGNAVIENFPFTSLNVSGFLSPVIVAASDYTFAGQLTGWVRANATTMAIGKIVSATALDNVAIDTSASLYISGFYLV